MEIQTRLFGTIEVGNERLITFPGGLVGFEACTRFVLVESEELEPLRWLQSVDVPHLAFPMADPGYFIDDYEVRITGDDEDILDVDEECDEIVTLVIVTLPDRTHPVRGNLRAPIVINLSNRIGRQVVLSDETYGYCQSSLAEAARVEK